MNYIFISLIKNCYLDIFLYINIQKTTKKMNCNYQDINNIKNDIKSIKLMFLGMLITTPIYYTSIYFLSKQACKNIFLTITEYMNVIEKNNNSNVSDIILRDELNNLSSSDSNSDVHELNESAYNNIPHTTNMQVCKQRLFNFY